MMLKHKNFIRNPEFEALDALLSVLLMCVLRFNIVLNIECFKNISQTLKGSHRRPKILIQQFKKNTK